MSVRLVHLDIRAARVGRIEMPFFCLVTAAPMVTLDRITLDPDSGRNWAMVWDSSHECVVFLLNCCGFASHDQGSAAREIGHV